MNTSLSRNDHIPTIGRNSMGSDCDCDEEDCHENGQEDNYGRCINLYCNQNPLVDLTHHECCFNCGESKWETEDLRGW